MLRSLRLALLLCLVAAAGVLAALAATPAGADPGAGGSAELLDLETTLTAGNVVCTQVIGASAGATSVSVHLEAGTYHPTDSWGAVYAWIIDDNGEDDGNQVNSAADQTSDATMVNVVTTSGLTVCAEVTVGHAVVEGASMVWQGGDGIGGTTTVAGGTTVTVTTTETVTSPGDTTTVTTPGETTTVVAAGGGGPLGPDDQHRLDLVWQGTWAVVGLLLVALVAPYWRSAWGFAGKLGGS